jgi:hypothetical protein
MAGLSATVPAVKPTGEEQVAEKERTAVDVARLVLDYVGVVVWPFVVGLASWWYRDVIHSLLPGAKVTLALVGQKIELTIPEIKQSVEDSLGGETLTDEQRDWLNVLYRVHRKNIEEKDKQTLRPLRDSGLIRAYPKGFLQYAKAVEITTLGRLLVERGGLR